MRKFNIALLLLVSTLAQASLNVCPRMPVATAVTNQFLTSISASGATTLAQPSCSNLSGVAASCSTDTTNAANISSGALPAGRMPALTGDVTTSAGAVATTLATVNSNTGSFGDSTHVPAITVNGKGLITAVTSTAISGSTPPGNYYWSGYYPASGSNEWSTTSTGPIGDFSVTGTIPSPTVLQQSGFTVSKATSSLPGINFSAPRTGTLKMVVHGTVVPGLNAAATQAWLQLNESTTSTTLDSTQWYITANNVQQKNEQFTLVGYFTTTASTTYNFKLQGFITSGTFYIGGYTAAGVSMLTFTMDYIN
jgi:hypothetical protein